jgi:hypothetical protein
MKKVLMITIFNVICLTAFNQGFNYGLDRSYCIEYGLQGGLSQYRGESIGIKSAFDAWDYKFAYGVFVRYNFDYDYSQTNIDKLLNKRFSLKVNLLHLNADAKKKGIDENDEGKKWDIMINELSAVLEYSFISFSSSYKENIKGYPLTPYICGGAGGFLYNIKDAGTGKKVFDKQKMALCGIVGGGLKAGLTNGIVFDVNAQLRVTSTDDLDNMNNGGMPDMYYFIGAGLSFNIQQIIHK